MSLSAFKKIVLFIGIFLIFLQQVALAQSNNNALSVTIVNNSNYNLKIANVQPGQYTALGLLPNATIVKAGGVATLTAQTTVPKASLSALITLSYLNANSVLGITHILIDDPVYASNQTPIMQVSSDDPTFKSSFIVTKAGQAQLWNIQVNAVKIIIENK